MRRWTNYFINLALGANALLLFLVGFEQQVVLPAAVQVAGRLHPLLLHFPIVLVLVLLFLDLLPAVEFRKEGRNLCWAFLSILTAFTALFGWVLSREPGYDAELITWHKWGGVVLSLLVFVGATAWPGEGRKIVKTFYSLLAGILLLVTAHEGAIITHGEDFLLAPIRREEKKAPVSLENAEAYKDVIQPLLEAKCLSCHNSKKSKGELSMETPEALLKGGKNGLLWDSTRQGLGLLLDRIHLSPEAKEHMPPKNKPQLTPEEQAILYYWIKAGAPFQKKLTAFAETDSFRVLTVGSFIQPEPVYSMAVLEEEVWKKLNDNYRLVQPVAAGSPALEVKYFPGAPYSTGSIKELLVLKDQLVSLQLSRMPVSLEDISLLRQFPVLSRLNLSFTGIGDQALPLLGQISALRELNLSGTSISKEGLIRHPFPLNVLYCWDTGVSGNDLPELEKVWKGTRLELGFRGDSVILPLNPPTVLNDSPVFRGVMQLQLRHLVQGAEIYYTLDGSEPDSVSSPRYAGPVPIFQTSLVKARAFKKGWNSSVSNSRWFYKTGLEPDSIRLLTEPDPAYKGDGANTLVDQVKGDLNFRTGFWLGYRKKPMEVEMEFTEPGKLKKLSISSLINISGYIMPPSEIQVWGAGNGGGFQLLAQLQPAQPKKDSLASINFYVLPVKENRCTRYRVKIKPLPALPGWHIGKGDAGWVFIDEIFIE